MLQSLFILSSNGEILIEKHWNRVTPRTVCDFFWDEVLKYPLKEDVPPIISASKYYLLSIYRDNLFLVGTVVQETPPLLILEFLHRIVDIIIDYFGTGTGAGMIGGNHQSSGNTMTMGGGGGKISGIDEVVIKENFSTIYQVK